MKALLKALKGWRTVLFNLAMTVGPIVEAIVGNADIRSVLGVKWYATLVVGNLIFRAITDTALGKGR